MPPFRRSTVKIGDPMGEVLAETARTLGGVRRDLNDQVRKDAKQPFFSCVKKVSAAFTVEKYTRVVEADASGGMVTVSLPAVADASSWGCWIIKADASANVVRLAPLGGGLINGAATYDLANQYDAALVVCDGTAWFAYVSSGGGGPVTDQPRFAVTDIAVADSPYTPLITDYVLDVDASGGNVTVALPAAAGADGWGFYIKKIDSSANTVTVEPDGAELIEGASSYTMLEQNSALLAICDGVAWYIYAIVGGVTVTRIVTMTMEGSLYVSTGKLRFYNELGVACTFSEVKISVGTVSGGAAVIADVHKNGATIFNPANRPQIAIGANTGSSVTFTVGSWAAGEYLTLDIDQVGTGATPGEYLTCHVVVQHAAIGWGAGNEQQPDFRVRAIDDTDSPYTPVPSDLVIQCDATGGPISITLPSVSGRDGWGLWISKVDSSANAVTLTPSGAETINGDPSYAMSDQWATAVVISDGVSWTLYGIGGGAASAPTTAPYVLGTATPDAVLTNAILVPRYGAHPDAQPASPNASDDEFESGPSGWTWVNQNGTTAAVSGSHLVLVKTTAVGGLDNSVLVKAVPGSTPWTLTVKLTYNGPMYASSGIGLYLRESGTGKLISLGLSPDATQATGVSAIILRWTNPTTYSASVASNQISGMSLYFKVTDTGVNLEYSWSVDGVNYYPMLTESRTAFMAGAPDQFGIGFYNTSGGVTSYLTCDWFRVT